MTYLIHAVKHCGDLTGKYAGNVGSGWGDSKIIPGWHANTAFQLCENIMRAHVVCGCIFEVVESEEQ